MTDRQYYEYYTMMETALRERHELDPDLFFAIFEGKIKPIVRNAFSGLSDSFAAIDFEDVCNDIFIKLWTRCVGAYFMNEKYETSAAWFLGWCKAVIKNHLTSMLRKRSMRPQVTLDDPDHPVTVSSEDDPSGGIVASEAVKNVFSAVAELPGKAEIKLTWFAVYLSVYDGTAEDRIEATRLFCERSGDVTLGELYDEVSSSVAAFCDVDLEKIASELDAGGRRNVRVSDLLGDDPAGKVSDWIYKTNKKLMNSLPPEVTKWNI